MVLGSEKASDCEVDRPMGHPAARLPKQSGAPPEGTPMLSSDMGMQEVEGVDGGESQPQQPRQGWALNETHKRWGAVQVHSATSTREWP